MQSSRPLRATPRRRSCRSGTCRWTNVTWIRAGRSRLSTGSTRLCTTWCASRWRRRIVGRAFWSCSVATTATVRGQSDQTKRGTSFLLDRNALQDLTTTLIYLHHTAVPLLLYFCRCAIPHIFVPLLLPQVFVHLLLRCIPTAYCLPILLYPYYCPPLLCPYCKMCPHCLAPLSCPYCCSQCPYTIHNLICTNRNIDSGFYRSGECASLLVE